MTFTGVSRGYDPTELVGGITQASCQFIVSNFTIEQEQWPGPPRKNDIVVENSINYTVEKCEEVYLGGSLCYLLQCKGDNR